MKNTMKKGERKYLPLPSLGVIILEEMGIGDNPNPKLTLMYPAYEDTDEGHVPAQSFTLYDGYAKNVSGLYAMLKAYFEPQLTENAGRDNCGVVKAPNITPEIIAAFKHVRQFYPEATLVVFNSNQRWQYMGEDFEDIRFGKGIDVSILQDAIDSAPYLPSAFEYYEEDAS